MKMPLFKVTLTSLILIGPLLGQWQIGPIYPEKPDYYNTNPNYNPFRFNPYSGRYNYAPIPYEPQRGGYNYDPFRFNWFRGGWDYRPWPEDGYGNPYNNNPY